MKWTLVTGGSKGLGSEICQSLASEGHSVLVHYSKSKQAAEDVVFRCRKQGVEAELIQGDFSSLETTKYFAESCLVQFPGIKNLINNVGNYLVKPAGKTTPEEWTALFQTNLNAPFTLCHFFLSSLQACQGSIVNIGVVGANNIHADVKRTAYMATKMSLFMLTKSLARELASSHVRVNMVSPGYIENAIDLVDAKLPMDRPASFDEVVRAISFLLNENNRYITGQNIEIGGGIGLLS